MNQVEIKEREQNSILTTLVPRLVCFIGGMATKAGMQLIERIKQEYSNLDGPYVIAIFDTAKELAMSRLDGLKVKFIYVRPLALKRLEMLTPLPAFCHEHVANGYIRTDDCTPGSGSKPENGSCYTIVHLPAVGSIISQMLGSLSHPAMAARIDEDIRFGGRKVDLTRTNVDIFAGIGGTSSLAVFVIAEYIRNWLESQNRPFHITGRFILASGYSSLPESIHPLLYKNMLIQLSYLDAVQSCSPLIKRQLAMVNGNRIYGGEGSLFEETILYGQRPGEVLSTEEFTNEIANCYFHELMGKAGTWLISRELDFRNTLAFQTINGKLRLYSSIGCRELTAIPNDANGRLCKLITRELLKTEKEQGASDFNKKVCDTMVSEAELNQDLLENCSMANIPTIHERTDIRTVEALWARLASDLREASKKRETFIAKFFVDVNKKIQETIRRDVNNQSIAHQIQIYREVSKCCKEKADSYSALAATLQNRNDKARKSDSSLRGQPTHTREWADNLLKTWQEIALTESYSSYFIISRHYNELVDKLLSKNRPLEEIQSLLEHLEANIPESKTEKPSIVSSTELLFAAKEQINNSLKLFRQFLTEKDHVISESALKTLLQKFSKGIEQFLLKKYNSIGNALSLLAEQSVNINERFEQEIEATVPMLTADRVLMTGNPLHETKVVILPVGTKAMLEAKGIDFGTLKSQVIEDNVKELVIVRAFRGYAMPVIPEVIKGIDYLFKDFKSNSSEAPPWLHVNDATPLPVLPKEHELQSAELFARILAVNGQDNTPTIEANGGIIYLCQGQNKIALGGEKDDLLDGLVKVISENKINPISINQTIDRFYETHADEVEEKRLIKMAQVHLNKARGADYITAMKIQTAIDRYLKNSASRSQSRTSAFCTGNNE